jgi:hypothetical protein
MIAVVGGKISQGQSSVAPDGFTKSLLTTSLSSYTLTTNDTYGLIQPIEGFNTADLGWGTVNAKTVTVSFWVRSSLTGTFGGAVVNSAANRSYTFNYTISSANTYEYKTVTIPGDTTGTWLTDNGAGILLRFGVGSTGIYTQAAGSWGTANAVQPAGNVSLVGTSGATFYITGVQLEVGSSATSFEYRPYGTELALCQRYFQRLGQGFTGNAEGTTAISINEKFQVPMRATPTFTVVSGQSCSIRHAGGDSTAASPTLIAPTGVVNGVWTLVDGFTGLTSNSPIQARNATVATLFIAASGEL